MPGINKHSTREEVLAAVKENAQAIEHASPEIKGDRKVMLAAATKGASAFAYASTALKSDKAFVLELVRIDGYALRYASAALKNDKEVVLTAIERGRSRMAIQITESLRNDPDVALAAVKLDPQSIHYVSVDMQNNPKIAMAAVDKDPAALTLLPHPINNDKGFLASVVEKNGMALKYVYYHRGDEAINLLAINQNYQAIQYVSEHSSYETKLKIIDAAFNKSSDALLYLPDHMKNNRQLMRDAAVKNPRILPHLSADLQKDKEFMLEVVSKNPHALEHVPAQMKDDKDVVAVAVAKDPKVYQHASHQMKEDSFIKRLEKQAEPKVLNSWLLPLRMQLCREQDPARKEAAKTMIDEIQEAAVDWMEDKNIDKLQRKVDSAHSKAKPVLEKQSGWKGIIDSLVNAVMHVSSYLASLVGHTQPHKEQTYFSTETNPMKEELRALKKQLENPSDQKLAQEEGAEHKGPKGS